MARSSRRASSASRRGRARSSPFPFEMPGAGDRLVPVAESLDDLLPAIGAGDATAFARWLAGAEGRLRDSLRSFAARVDTEAVLQEALIRVWQVAPRVTPDGKPDALVRLGVRIARNLAVSEV